MTQRANPIPFLYNILLPTLRYGAMFSLLTVIILTLTNAVGAFVPSSSVIARINGVQMTEEEAQLILDKKTPLSGADIEKAVLFQLAVSKALAQGIDQEPSTAISLKKVMYKAYLRDIAAKNPSDTSVSKKELAAYYDENPLFRTAQIVLNGPPEKNEQKLREIRKSYSQNPNFKKLVLKYSEDVSALQGGDLDYRGLHNLPEPFYTALKNTPQNTLSKEVLEKGNTFLLVWSEKLTFEKAPQPYKSMLHAKLAEQKELALLRSSLAALRQSAAVEILVKEKP